MREAITGAPLVAALLVATACQPRRPPAETLLDLVPAESVAAVLVRPAALKMVAQQLADDPDLQKELGGFLVGRLGIDPTRIDAAGAFVTAPDGKQFAVFARMPIDGQPKWPAAWPVVGIVAGADLHRVDGPLVALALPTGLYAGTEAGVRAAIAVAHHEKPAVGKDSPLAELLAADADASIVAAVSATATTDPVAAIPIGNFGARTAVAGLSSRRAFAWVSGDPAKLPLLRDAIKSLLDTGIDWASAEKQRALTGNDIGAGARAILVYHGMVELAARHLPTLAGDRLTIEYVPKVDDGTSQVMIYTAVAGVLAAVAIPAFMKYTARAKAAQMR